MGLQLPGGLAEVLSMMGVQFPATDEDQLAEAGAAWETLAGQCDGWAADLKGAVDHVTSCNEGPGAEAFASYMGGQSNITGIEALATAARQIASGHEAAASAVKELKAAIIAVASTAKANVELQKQQPNADTAALTAWLQQAGAQLRELDQKTAAKIQEG